MVFNCDVSQAHSLFELFLSLWSAPFSSLHPADHFSWKLFSHSLLHSVLRCLFLSYDSKTRCTFLYSPDWVYTLIWHRLPVCEGWTSLCMHSILEKKTTTTKYTFDFNHGYENDLNLHVSAKSYRMSERMSIRTRFEKS